MTDMTFMRAPVSQMWLHAMSQRIICGGMSGGRTGGGEQACTMSTAHATRVMSATESFANTMPRWVSETQPTDEGECKDGGSCVAEKA